MSGFQARLSIWDIHHHWVNEADYIDGLLREMDRLGIERTALIAMGEVARDLFLRKGPAVGACDNNDLARMLRLHRDRFSGLGYVRLGKDGPDAVDRLADMGMAGLKFHLALKPYGDPEYFEVFARADALRMPCLFHTGIFYPPHPMPGLGIRSENYRPIHLEPIAHEFPTLPLVAAHLGVCWNDEAASLARICPNIYVDLSGRVDGWRSSRPAEWFRQLFYWPTAHEKILFGSDAHYAELESVIGDQQSIFRSLGWSDAQLASVFHENARRIFRRT